MHVIKGVSCLFSINKTLLGLEKDNTLALTSKDPNIKAISRTGLNFTFRVAVLIYNLEIR